MDHDYRARLAVLESQVGDVANNVHEHRLREEHYLREHSKLLGEIRHEQAKMKGFWGGVVFVFSAIAAAIGMALNKFFN